MIDLDGHALLPAGCSVQFVERMVVTFNAGVSLGSFPA